MTSAADSGTFAIGGTTTVNRLGFGTMQLTGEGVWGDPKDPNEAVRVLQRAVERGVTFFDTADSYGPAVAEPLLKKALRPYNDDVVIATKAGLTRSGPGDWRPVGRPEYLRQQAEMSLRLLGLDSIPLFQLHRIDSKVPLADQVGELAKLQQEGKIQHIGLSEVGVDDVKAASEFATIASVQNLYNLANRDAEKLLDYATDNSIAFIPWFPLATGELAKEGGKLDTLAKRHNASASQIALAWLLQRSPVVLPIPGTKSVAHVDDNIDAAGVSLSADEFAELEAAVK